MSNKSEHKNFPCSNYEINTCKILLEPNDESITYIISINDTKYCVSALITVDSFVDISVYNNEQIDIHDQTMNNLDKDIIYKFFKEHINTASNANNMHSICKSIWQNGLHVQTSYDS